MIKNNNFKQLWDVEHCGECNNTPSEVYLFKEPRLEKISDVKNGIGNYKLVAWNDDNRTVLYFICAKCINAKKYIDKVESSIIFDE